MKRYIGIILLTISCYTLPAGQEELTGSNLKKAYNEYKDAYNVYSRYSDSRTEKRTRASVSNEILRALETEGADLDKIKKDLKSEVESYKKIAQKLQDDEREKLVACREAQKRADKLIDAAARKIG